MTFYRTQRNPRREQFIQLFSRLISGLQKAYDEKKHQDNLTMDKLAERLGVTKSRVSKILNGHSNMTIETLSNVAFELGRDVSIFMPEINFTQASSSSHTFAASFTITTTATAEYWHTSGQIFDELANCKAISRVCNVKPAVSIAQDTKNIPFNLANLEMEKCTVN